VIEIPRSGSAEIEADGRTITVSKVERPMWPVAGLTKADLLAYYAQIAPVLIPHVAGRPLRVVRFPEGVHLQGTVDTELAGAPEWVSTLEGSPVISDLASLLWVIDHAAVELHVPLGPEPERPCTIFFDLEPGAGRGLADCCVVAGRLRAMLMKDGLAAYVKTSGAFGLHVVVPVNGGADAPAARAYGRSVAERLAAEDADLITCDARRTSRSRRVLVDWRPNAPRRWSIAVYSLRAMLPGPGVSAPVGWEDVAAGAEGELEALHRSPKDVREAAISGGDTWRPVLDAVQTPPAPG
jgi:bifunctional non-homologous end joining protein LigD